MLRRTSTIALAATLILLGGTEMAHAQRGRGGGRAGGGVAHPGGGGMGRPGGMARPGGGMAHPGGMARPSRPMNRPAMGGMNRPMGGGNMARPGAGGMTRPASRPSPGGGNRPGMGGNLAGGGLRPGGGFNRPGMGGNLPGRGGGLRPGGGGRPGPGGGGNQWAGGNRPGWNNRPGAGGGGTQWPGGGNRPGWNNRPGAGGSGTQWPGGNNRPGWNGGGNQWAGGGNRPPWNRPGWNGGGTQWAGGNRPGWNNGQGIGNRNNWGIGNGNIGSGNIGQIGDNLGVVNRPNYGGNTFINNNVNNVSRSGYYGGNNYFGGGGWGGGNWGRYGGYGGFGGGWAAPYYGGWYRGWGGNLGSFWGGYGLGALTSFGLGSAFGSAGYYSALGSYGFGGYGFPIYGGYGYGTGFGVYDYFPTWGMSSIGGWGLGPMATTWLGSNYVNPYASVMVQSQPAAAAVYDYSQPINVTAAPPDPSAADTSEQVFSAARDSFKAGDYQRALDLADQVVKQTPNAPVVHEFRALCLFALRRYDEAASVVYAVLSAGPCWNWSTLVGLYPDTDTYTNQLRALEAEVRNHRNAPPLRFLLAYHYLVEGNEDAAATEFANVVKLQPNDQLSSSFARALTRAKDSTTAPATAVASSSAPTAAAPEPAGAGEPPPPPPPAELTGAWKAAPTPDTAITLAIQPDGAYTWDIANKGQKQQTITGHAVYVDDVLSLTQDQGPPLAGKVESKDAGRFVFHLMGGGNNAPAITFTR